MVNIDRIRAQLWLTEQSLDKNNPEMAFAHAFIPHTTTFPAIKAQLERSVGDQSTKQLESLLTDLPLKMRTGEYSQEETKQNIGQIRMLLDQISQQSIGPQFLSDKGIHTSVLFYPCSETLKIMNCHIHILSDIIMLCSLQHNNKGLNISMPDLQI